MEIKEFSSVSEAIEALDKIKNIDYSSVEGVSELTEREFYNSLMNNLLRTKNIKFTKEERENYKAALRKKGLLTYRDWKDRQPVKKDEKVTWKDSVEHGTLDAPVNLFSKLLQADEEKIKYIDDIVRDSDVVSGWIENNSKIVEEIKENEKIVSEILNETEKEFATVSSQVFDEIEKEKIVNKTISESELNFAKEVQSIIEEREKADDGILNKVEETIETDFKTVQINGDEKKINEISEEKKEKEEFKFNSPEEAINALKSIEKFEYKRQGKIDTIKEKEFYSNIMKNLIASRELKFDNFQSAKYQEALQSIGCKQKEQLERKLRQGYEEIGYPEELITKILQDRANSNYQAFKDVRAEVNNNERLNAWLELAQEDIQAAKEKQENAVSKQKTQTKALVEYKKPSLFKRVTKRAAIAFASFAALFGTSGCKTEVEELVDFNNNAKNESQMDNIDDTEEKKYFESLGVKNFADLLKEEVDETVRNVHETIEQETKKELENKKEPETIQPVETSIPQSVNFVEKKEEIKKEENKETKKEKEEPKKQSNTKKEPKKEENYTKKPESNAKKYGDANSKKLEEVKENKKKEEEVKKAQEKAESNAIEVVVGNTSEKKEENYTKKPESNAEEYGDVNSKKIEEIEANKKKEEEAKKAKENAANESIKIENNNNLTQNENKTQETVEKFKEDSTSEENKNISNVTEENKQKEVEDANKVVVNVQTDGSLTQNENKTQETGEKSKEDSTSEENKNISNVTEDNKQKEVEDANKVVVNVQNDGSLTQNENKTQETEEKSKENITSEENQNVDSITEENKQNESIILDDYVSQSVGGSYEYGESQTNIEIDEEKYDEYNRETIEIEIDF